MYLISNGGLSCNRLDSRFRGNDGVESGNDGVEIGGRIALQPNINAPQQLGRVDTRDLTQRREGAKGAKSEEIGIIAPSPPIF